MTTISLASELARATSPSMFDLPVPGRFGWWKTLAFSVSLVIWGTYIIRDPSLDPDDADLTVRFADRKLLATGWIVAVGGVLVTLRAIANIIW